MAIAFFIDMKREVKLPKSARKHIRFQKARIRREVFDLKEQQQRINELYGRFLRPRQNVKQKESAEKNAQKMKQTLEPIPLKEPTGALVKPS